MKITIAERLHPFSHRPGTSFALPQSSFAVKIYPVRLEFTDLKGIQPNFYVDFSFQGPMQGFTAELDLERGEIRVFGTAREGYLCYLLQTLPEGILLTVEKMADPQVTCRHSLSPQTFSLMKGSSLLIPTTLNEKRVAPQERLSLGMHKSQDWEGITRRLDFKEIFPLWHRLSAWMPTSEIFQGGNFQLLAQCRHAIEAQEKGTILSSFELLFRAGFEGMLVPRLFDTEYQGILPVLEKTSSSAPLALLKEGGSLIRSLFFQEKEGQIVLLPCLPAEFHCGRMTEIQTAEGHRIDMEWSKKRLRRLRLIAHAAEEVVLRLPKGITSSRIRIGRKTITHSSIDAQGILKVALDKNEQLHLDRFH